MKNLSILTILFTYLIIGCEKDTNNTENIPVDFLKGWEISKSRLDFYIAPQDLFFINRDTGFVVGLNGSIFKTIDAGNSWKKENSGTTLHIHSVFFINKNIGFASGQAMNSCLDDDCDKGSFLLKTTDGGETWDKTFFPDYSKIYSLHFFDELNGLAIILSPDMYNSRFFHIAKTSDGGSNWVLIDIPINSIYQEFHCVDNIVFIEAANQKIFKSIDYGENWVTISTPLPENDDVRKVYFYNENIAYLDGNLSNYKSIDGGTTWDLIDYPLEYFNMIHFYDEREGFTIKSVSEFEGGDFPTFKGCISYQTFNGGDTWENSNLTKSIGIGIYHFPIRDLGYAFNGNEFYTIKRK